MKRADFVQALVLVAQSCQFELSESLIAIYDQTLQRHGYPKLCWALKTILVNRRTRDPFPSIREIQETIEPALEAKDIATDSAARLLGAVSKFGRGRPQEAEVYVGEVGWRALRCWGTWSQLCEQLTTYNGTTMMAQFRDLCSTVVKKAQLGLPDGPVALPGPRPEMKALTDKIKSV